MYFFFQFRQEAHEAIRPSVSSDKFQESGSINVDALLSSPAYKKGNLKLVYEKIYRRTLASVMRPSLSEYTMAGGRLLCNIIEFTSKYVPPSDVK